MYNPMQAPFQGYPWAPQPYGQPWPQPQAAQQGGGQISNVRTVANEAEARQCYCPLGSRMLLMDANEPRFYLKETGMDNVSTVRAYEFHEFSDEAPQTSDEPAFEEWRKQYEPLIRQSAAALAAGAAEPSGADEAVHAPAGEGRGGAHLR